MAANKKPRKKYRPRAELRTPHYFAKLPKDLVFTAEMLVAQAMYALTHGAGTLTDWQSVCTALNLGLALDEQSYAAEHAAVFREAMLAHRECGRREFGYSGAELGAVNTALAIHYEQIGKMTQRELDLAMGEIDRHNRKQGGRERITVKAP